MAQYSRKLKKGTRWWYKFSLNNKIYFSKAIYLSKNEAKRAENDKFEEMSKKLRNPSYKANISLLEAINERLDYIKTKKSRGYYRENKRYYSELIKEFGDREINGINKKQMNDFLLKMSQRLQTQGKDNYAVNYALRVYKALFQMVIKNHELELKNPCYGISFFPIVKRLKYIPTDDEIESLKKLCDSGERLLIDFVLNTGARISEALKVNGKDIIGGYVILYTRKSKDSNLVPRKVPHHMKLPNLKDDERLFSRWADIPKFLERKLKKLEQKKWSYHNLRHRYASLLSKQGKPLFEIMTLLGHTNLKTTQIYLQLLN
ncbi:MAG: site-specific integrase [Ignavibacteria bacterium]